MSERDIGREIKRLEKKMLDIAKNLECEQATRVRDELFQLRKHVFGDSHHESLTGSAN